MKTGNTTFGKMQEFPEILVKKLAERKASNSLRKLGDSRSAVDFFSNDYLGLAREPDIFFRAGELVEESGPERNGATGSRLLSGNHALYSRVESFLEILHGAPVLIFNSGYDANIGFFSSVPQRSDIVIYDEEIHASIRDGIRMGWGRSVRFSHNNLEDLEKKLGRLSPGHDEIYVVTESVFSMGGDSPDLERLTMLCRKHRCRLIVDEAHAIGVRGSGGKGFMQEMGLHGDCFARILTFGKALGAHGAAIAGGELLKNYLVNFARSLIYTTALAPHSLATLLAAHLFLESSEGEKRVGQLKELITFFREEVARFSLADHFMSSQSAIQSCVLPGNETVKKVSEQLRKLDFDVRPILSPTVEAGRERLRFCLHQYNTEAQVRDVLGSLREILDTL